MISTSHLASRVLTPAFKQLRRTARRTRLQNAIRILRQLLHFGPWRVVPIRLIRAWKGPAMLSHAPSACGLHLNSYEVARTLHKQGVYPAGVISQATLEPLTRLTDKLPPEEYHQTHQSLTAVSTIAEDPAIQNVLRAYFGCEPVLIESSIFVTRCEQDLPVLDQNHYHFDYAGWQSMNVFVYLTDVTPNSSYHIALAGSHKTIGVRDIIKGTITDNEANQRFAGQQTPITGPAGTVFFENVEVFHKRSRGNERRVMLNMAFTSHRNLLSYGRASQATLKSQQLLYRQLLAKETGKPVAG